MDRWEVSGVNIGSIYYAHGLKCAKYPAHFILFVGVVTILCSLPFFITTSGAFNSPRPWRTPWLNYRLPSEDGGGAGRRGDGPASDWIVNDPSLMSFRTPIWFIGLPVVIFQQVYVDVQIDCDSFENLCRNGDHLSLSKKAMALMVDQLMSAERSCSSVMHLTFAKFAHHHSNKETPLPSFISSLLSPLNDDFQLMDSVSVKPMPGSQANMSLLTKKELFYGGFWEVGHAHLNRKQKSKLKELKFAATLALEPKIDNFDQITECVQTLNNIWPLDTGDLQFMKHIYYESEWTLTNFAPLICLYSVVFLYISFSVGKIDLVRSKLGLGFTAVITVLCSLTMSLGICTFFGLSITVSGSEVFPFVVVVIGLENILIITKAVISTDPGLDVKYRIAEGLGREGKALTKNLLTVLGLVILGVFTFNYAMKEFCIIALVGLLCDFFLHITFFTTVLSIDLRRMELSDLSFHSKSIGTSDDPVQHKWRMSKRDRVNTFLARNRFAQRFFAVVLFVYFMSVISHTQQFHSFMSTMVTPTPSISTLQVPLRETQTPIPHETSMNRNQTIQKKAIKDYIKGLLGPELNEKDDHVSFRSDEDGFGIPCLDNSYCWKQMVNTHWPRLFLYHNLTLEKRFITVLPPIMLNHRVGFSAQKLFAQSSGSKDIYATLSLIMDTLLSAPNVFRWLALHVVSGIVVIYLITLSREARYTKKKEDMEKETQKLTTVSKLKGHVQDIESLCVDEGSIATASLDGMVYVWDISRRECSTAIDRRELRLRDYRDSVSHHVEGCELTDIKSTSSPPTSSSTSLSSSLHNSGKFTKSLPPTPSLSLPPPPPLPSPLPTPSSLPTSSSTPTTVFPVHIPQKIIPGFLKRLSMPAAIGTILKRSPEKLPEKTIPEEDHPPPALPPKQHSMSEMPAHLQSTNSPALPPARRPLRHSFSGPSTHSRSSSSMGSSNSTKAVTTYSRPLVSHGQLSSSSKKSLRSLSMDSASGGGRNGNSQEMNSVSNWSAESVSLMSEDNSDLSYGTPEMVLSPLPPIPSGNGFQFSRHFSFYSQFTSELALMPCPDSVDELWDTYTPSPVWCMDMYRDTVIVGCGNGQIEAWSASSGSLKFCSSLEMPGVTVIKGHPTGIISGHLDGSLQLTNHVGRLIHGVQAHHGPVTSLCCYSNDNSLVSAGYDGVTKVYRITDFLLVRSHKFHHASIVTLSLVENDIYLSACSSGTICVWSYKSGQLIHQLNTNTDGSADIESSNIMKACCNSTYIVALTSDSKVRIWTRSNSSLSNVIELGRYASDITLISQHHFAIALQCQIIVYDIVNRREVAKKELETIGMPIIRHLTTLEPSKLVCTTGKEVQMVPTGLKIKME